MANARADERLALKNANPLFYGDIAGRWKREPYVREMSKLVSEDSTLVGHIGVQIHVNADIATVKFKWTNRAVRWLARSYVVWDG